MSIPAIRTSVPVASGQRTAPLTITIHHSKLAQFLQSERKIGPLTCREWNRKLEEHFAFISKVGPNFDFRRLFPDLKTFLLASMPLHPQRDGINDQMRFAIQLQFRTQFPNRLAAELGTTFGQLLPACSVFMELMDLSANLEHRQSEGKAIGELLTTGNRILAKMSEQLPVKFVVN
jgi:hypothetical protein